MFPKTLPGITIGRICHIYLEAASVRETENALSLRRNLKIMKRIFTFFILLATAALTAQNNECADAIEIFPATGCDAVTGTFSGSTLSGGVPVCATGASQDVWYRFTATAAMMEITLFGTAGVSNGFEVYEDNCAGNRIICRNVNNAAGSGESAMFNDFAIGTTYYIRVFNAYTAPTSNTFSICLREYPAPANDDCADAIAVTPGATCVELPFTMSGATLDGPASTGTCSPNPSQDVWFSFVATAEMMRVWASGNSAISTGIQIYQDSCDGPLFACRNVNGQGQGETVLSNNFVIGTTYFVRVVNEFATPLTTANFQICIQEYSAPVNDDCAAATVLTPTQACVMQPFTLSGATLDGSPSTWCSPNPSQDVWFSFVATDQMMRIVITGEQSISVGFQLYENSCNGPLFGCLNSNGQGMGESLLGNTFTIGQTYYIRVVNEFSTPLSVAALNICLQGYPAPANDDCADAIALTPASTCTFSPQSFSGSTLDGPTSAWCSPNPSQDVWFSFTATSASMQVYLAADPGISSGIQLYEGSCTGTMLGCQNAGGQGQAETLSVSNLVVGELYFVRVVNEYSTSLSISGFDICVLDPSLATVGFNSHNLSIYPNPSADSVSISLPPGLSAIATFYNAMGMKVMECDATGVVDVRSLAGGIYQVAITAEGKTATARFVKL